MIHDLRAHTHSIRLHTHMRAPPYRNTYSPTEHDCTAWYTVYINSMWECKQTAWLGLSSSLCKQGLGNWYSLSMFAEALSFKVTTLNKNLSIQRPSQTSTLVINWTRNRKCFTFAEYYRGRLVYNLTWNEPWLKYIILGSWKSFKNTMLDISGVGYSSSVAPDVWTNDLPSLFWPAQCECKHDLTSQL